MYIPKADIVDIVVIVMDRSKFPPSVKVHILDAPPPGEQPVIKRPSCKSGRPGIRSFANPKES